jgi:hypothetical protein
MIAEIEQALKSRMGYRDNPSSPRCSGCGHVEVVDFENGEYICKANPAFHFDVVALGTCRHHTKSKEATE